VSLTRKGTFQWLGFSKISVMVTMSPFVSARIGPASGLRIELGVKSKTFKSASTITLTILKQPDSNKALFIQE
jgi:hypothetical protein